jgi:hypothetical protein
MVVIDPPASTGLAGAFGVRGARVFFMPSTSLDDESAGSIGVALGDSESPDAEWLDAEWLDVEWLVVEFVAAEFEGAEFEGAEFEGAESTGAELALESETEESLGLGSPASAALKVGSGDGEAELVALASKEGAGDEAESIDDESEAGVVPGRLVASGAVSWGASGASTVSFITPPSLLTSNACSVKNAWIDTDFLKSCGIYAVP